MIFEGEVLSADLPMPELLQPDGSLRLLYADEYDAIHREALRLFCHQHARYGLPTVELIVWLLEKLAGRIAIEIGAGSGDLAPHLGIPATDSWCQEKSDVKIYYAVMGQPRIRYPERVEKLDAAEAIQKYDPEIVVASWVTHWISPDAPVPEGGGNVYGVREDLIVDSGRTYIFVGNEAVHRHKPILDRPHETYRLPFLRSRASRAELDCVWIWNS